MEGQGENGARTTSVRRPVLLAAYSVVQSFPACLCSRLDLGLWGGGSDEGAGKKVYSSLFLPTGIRPESYSAQGWVSEKGRFASS